MCVKTSVNPPNKNKSKPSKLSNLYIYENWFPDNDILDKEVSILGKEVTVLGEEVNKLRTEKIVTMMPILIAFPWIKKMN